MVVIVTETMDADLLGLGISHGSSIDCLRGHRLLNIPRTAGMGPWIIGNEIDHHLETAEEVAVGLIVLISTLTFLATVEDVMIGHPERIGYHHHPEMSGYHPEMIGYYLATIDCYLATIGYHSGMTGLLRVVEGGMSAMIDGMNGIAEIGNTTIAAARAKHAVEAALL